MKFDSWRVKDPFSFRSRRNPLIESRCQNWFFCGDPKSAGMQQKCEGWITGFLSGRQCYPYPEKHFSCQKLTHETWKIFLQHIKTHIQPKSSVLMLVKLKSPILKITQSSDQSSLSQEMQISLVFAPVAFFAPIKCMRARVASKRDLLFLTGNAS